MLLVLRSFLNVRFQNHLECLKSGACFCFFVSIGVYICGSFVIFFSCSSLKFLLAVISLCDLSVLTNLTLQCKAVLHE